MGKRVVYTKITPLPSNVPRQLAIEMLHSHEEVIKLNPLVTGVTKVDAPRDAPNDEYFSSWYEIAEIITWGFGMKKKISFRGVFHDLPYGLQSHVYAPMGVDLRNKYRIGGNQPGEPREARELGVDTPLDGLYLREDVEIVCNIALASFVKKETKEATGKMIQRLARKAELLDEGKLHAMFEDGKLKTAKPSDFADADSTYASNTPPLSPVPSIAAPSISSPRLDKRGFGNYHDVVRNASQHRASQYLPPQPLATGPDPALLGADLPGRGGMAIVHEMPGDMYLPQGSAPNPLKASGAVFRSELAGDSSFSTASSPSSRQPSPQFSHAEVKTPNQYQAYPPPTQQHPAERNSYPPPSPLAQSTDSTRTPNTAGHLSTSTTGDWTRRSASTASHASTDRTSSNPGSPTYQNFSRPSIPNSNSSGNIIMPDHQRFANPAVAPPPPSAFANLAAEYQALASQSQSQPQSQSQS